MAQTWLTTVQEWPKGRAHDTTNGRKHQDRH